MSPKLKCHKKLNVSKTQFSPKSLSIKHKCHQNTTFTTWINPCFFYLPNGSGSTRSPGLVHINPNGLKAIVCLTPDLCLLQSIATVYCISLKTLLVVSRHYYFQKDFFQIVSLTEAITAAV